MISISPDHLKLGQYKLFLSQESELYRPLLDICELLASGLHLQAIRELDRMVRVAPLHDGQLLPLLGHLLLNYSYPLELAMSTLLRASQLAPSAGVEADLVLGFIRLEQVDTARRRLTAALTDFCAEPDSALCSAARVFLQRSPSDHGFVTLTSTMCLLAELGTQSAAAFELRQPDGQTLSRVVPRVIDGRACGEFKLRSPAAVQFLSTIHEGKSLLAGGRIFPIQFKADARSVVSGRMIQGWAYLHWNPQIPLAIEVQDEAGNRRRIRADRPGPSGQWCFELDIDQAGLGSVLKFDLLLPDGRRFEFPDSPLMIKSPLSSYRRPPVSSNLMRRPRELAANPASRVAVDVIIPVYRDREQTLACIESARDTLQSWPQARIIVIDDASPEAELAANLDQLAAEHQILLIRNHKNLGFSASINRAMSESRSNDAVLLNSDTLVFGDWLARLQAAAYQHKRNGSVTPLSDDDSVVSISSRASSPIDPAELEQLDRYAAAHFGDVRLTLPVGVGFCLYLRRDCWNDVGPFDAVAFPKGYGEECDWSMRAQRRGWRHRLAAHVFVHHAGGGSFGSRRLGLQDRADRLLNLRHPGYDAYVQRFLRKDPLRKIRRGFDSRRLSMVDAPIVLIVMHALPGGVDRFVAERCDAIRDSGRFPVLLRPTRCGPDSCMLWSSSPTVPAMHFSIPDETRELIKLLKQLPIESIELHHFLGIDSRLISAVLSLPIPYDVYLHDYSWICPRITLMDQSHRYCGEPQVRVCESCIQRNGSELIESIGVKKLRERSERWLAGARRLKTPSRDAQQRYRRYFPGLTIKAQPLELPVSPLFTTTGLRSDFSENEPVRVALIGGIGEHKGYRVLIQCVRDAIKRKLRMEFVIIGYTAKDRVLQKTGKVFITGPYRDAEFPDLVQREQPDVIWLPSVWPETWCYTLTHALQTGLPIVSYKIGAIAERLKQHGVGEQLDLLESPSVINDRLIASAIRFRQLRA